MKVREQMGAGVSRKVNVTKEVWERGTTTRVRTRG